MPWRQFLLGATILAVAAVSARCDEANWRAVAVALGKAGAETPDGIYRVGLLRTDLKVVVDGVELKPALALGSWLTFRLKADKAAVMGDLVLAGKEVSPVMKKLAAAGSKSQRCTIIYCALRPQPSICIFVAEAIPLNSPPLCTTVWR